MSSRQCACGCCQGVAPATPVEVFNRPALPQVAYRPGVYAQFKASLQAGLTSADRPALAALTTRAGDDFTMALLDGVASVADVLTFYTERLAQESYLRTATERLSLTELGRLVGYRLRPGVAAATDLAFHVEPPPPAAVSAATSPFHRVRQPESVPIPAGTPVRSVPGPGEQQQVFETVEPIEASPRWNTLRPLQTRKTVVGSGRTSLYTAGLAANLKPGDLLLFHGAAGFEVRPIASAARQDKLDRTLVTWQDALTVAGPLTAYVMRKRLSVFGWNAPLWKSMAKEFKISYGCETCADWPSYWIQPMPSGGWGDPADYPSQPWYLRVDVDGSHPDLGGSHIVLSDGTAHRHFTVASLAELSRAEFAISGKVTRVKLSGSYSQYLTFFDKVRQTTVYAGSEQLTLAEEPDTSPVTGGQITVSGHVADLEPGRRLLVVGQQTETATLLSAVKSGPDTVLTFTQDLAHHHARDTVQIFGNVAAATHGETVHQLLGDGQAAKAFQRFALAHAPLTFVQADNPAGASSTLELRVNDVLWTETPTLYPARPGDRVYATADTPAGAVEVGFGDGVRGARVPTGQHNVRARYRKGTGAAGNLPAGALTQLGSPPLGVTGVTNPAPALGGADPDAADHARAGIPLSTTTLGRAVSLTDYADFSRTFPGIAKAAATVLPVRHVRTIVVTVAGPGGTPVPQQVRARLVNALHGYGDPLVPVVVVPHRQVPFQLRMKVRRDPAYELSQVLRAVADTLTASFGFAARDFARPVQQSEVIAAAHRAAGVVAVDLDLLYRGTAQSHQQRLLADGPQATQSQVYGAELLLLTADPLTWLTEMPT
ncbi:putative baseplate assembly protein [Catellatospora vulcania]|uniref:putative baseplate assembly protein n=1 Tax=Catellatospora vulcania TaxID=1460450 RepID=UPI0012D39663|nr:putative baseplate assembly protein [Catellatospora vulcania]